MMSRQLRANYSPIWKRLWRFRCHDFHLILKVLVTSAAILILLRNVQWNDSEQHPVNTGFQPISPSPGRLQASETHTTRAVVNEPGLKAILLNLDWQWFTAYVGCAICLAISLSTRWFMALRHVAPALTWTGCLIVWGRSQVIGLLPTGQLGGDAYRILTSREWCGGALVAGAAVVLERLIGIICLIGIGGCGFLWADPLAWPRALFSATVVPAGLALLVFILLILAQYYSLWFRNAITGRLPLRFVGTLRELRNTPRKLRLRLRSIGFIFALSICAQVFTTLCFVSADRAAGLHTPAHFYFLIVPCVLMVQAAPIHVAGLGILESGLVMSLMSLTGCGVGPAIAAAATCRIFGSLWAAMLAVASWSIRFDRSHAVPTSIAQHYPKWLTTTTSAEAWRLP